MTRYEVDIVTGEPALKKKVKQLQEQSSVTIAIQMVSHEGELVFLLVYQK